MFLGGHFEWNGVSSWNMYNCILGNISEFDGRDSGVTKNIQRYKKNGEDWNYKIERESYSTTIHLCFEQTLSEKEKRDVIRWLQPDDNFHELVVEDTQISYFVMFTKIKTNDVFGNGLYIECEIETMDAYGYTRPYLYSQTVLDLGNIIINNHSGIKSFYYPESVKITFRSNDNVVIENLTLGESMTIKGVANEVVHINCARELVTSTVKKYKYSDITNFLRFGYGDNRLKITGKCRIDIVCRYPVENI